MVFKDKLTMLLSVVAFCISMYSLISGEMRFVEERKRTIRSQLTDVLGKLIVLQLDTTKLQREAKDDREYLQQISSVLGQQNGFLIDQAVFLADQIPNLTTTYELNTIAVANSAAGNLLVAEKYYKKAIDMAPTDLYKSMAMRSYAEFLYAQARLQEGRQLLRSAIDLLRGEDNLVRYTKGSTYLRWAVLEFNYARSLEKANTCFEASKQEYSAIDVEFIRNSALAALESQRQNSLRQGQQPPSQPAPFGHGEN